MDVNSLKQYLPIHILEILESVSQILREINYGNLETLIKDILAISKPQKFDVSKFQIAFKAFSETPKWPNTISEHLRQSQNILSTTILILVSECLLMLPEGY